VHLATREDEVLLHLLNSTPVVDGVPRDLLARRRGAGLERGPGAASDHRPWLPTCVGSATGLQAVVRGVEPPDARRPFLTGVDLRGGAR
jgi:hypothetical protein